MRILVAGGAGYIGSRLVPSLVEHGYRVDVIDALWFGNHLPPEVNVVRRDLFECRPSDFEGTTRSSFSQASRTIRWRITIRRGISSRMRRCPLISRSPRRKPASADSYMRRHVLSTAIHRIVSTTKMTRSRSYPYGISKLQGERAVLQLAAPGFSVIALRQGTVCGWSAHAVRSHR